MRIAYLLFDPGIPVGGTKGASIHVSEFCRAASALGHEIHLIATRVVGDGVPSVILHHIELPYIKASDGSKFQAANEFSERAFDVLREIKPDLIYERLSLFFGEGRQLAIRLGIQRLLEVNAPIVDERIEHFNLDLIDEARAKEAAAIYGADVIAVSESLCAYIRTNEAKTISVFPNGVDTERFGSVIKYRYDTQSMSLKVTSDPKGPSDPTTIGFVGSLKTWHGVNNLILASNLLFDRGIFHRLLIVGDGPEMTSLKQLSERSKARARIHFVGALEMSEIPSYLSSMDIGVAPYLLRGDFYFSPLKILEYMASSIAVIATRTPSIEAIVGGDAFLLSDPSPEAIANAIATLIDDPTRRMELGKKARDRVETSFTWNQTVSSILEVAASQKDGPDDVQFDSVDTIGQVQ
ncbi:glycosyltransferase family 4 protein [Acidithrix sp. C25]|uniref:glycosyltransferase family 4 protein n=1 Tax=Acidithrix sp. C25 TaxID=1671482 RepID=UPI00191BB37F|nr:glycosyltransferase family 4 protein [Acidithrix sp. C25]